MIRLVAVALNALLGFAAGHGGINQQMKVGMTDRLYCSSVK